MQLDASCRNFRWARFVARELAPAGARSAPKNGTATPRSAGRSYGSKLPRHSRGLKPGLRFFGGTYPLLRLWPLAVSLLQRLTFEKRKSKQNAPAPASGASPRLGVPSFRHCSGGTPPQAIHGLGRLARHPCRAAPYAMPTLGLLKGQENQEPKPKPKPKPKQKTQKA